MVVSYKEYASMIGAEYNAIKMQCSRGVLISCSPGKIDTENVKNIKYAEMFRKRKSEKFYDFPKNKRKIIEILRKSLSDEELMLVLCGEAFLVCMKRDEIKKGIDVSSVKYRNEKECEVKEGEVLF
jgi:hypothetical protein